MDSPLLAFIHFKDMQIESESTDESTNLGPSWIPITNFELHPEGAAGITGSYLTKAERQQKKNLQQEKAKAEARSLKEPQSTKTDKTNTTGSEQEFTLITAQIALHEAKLSELEKLDTNEHNDSSGIGDFKFTKYADNTSPDFHKQFIRFNRDKNTAKETLSEISVRFYTYHDGKARAISQYTFQNCRLTSLTISSDEESPITEEITISYQKIYIFIRKPDWTWSESKWDIIEGKEPSGSPDLPKD